MNAASHFIYLFKRELWEHKGSVLWAPVAIAGAAILLIALSLALGLDDFSRNLDQIAELAGGQRIGGDEPTRRIDFARGALVPAQEDLDWVLWGSRFIGLVAPSLHGIAVGFELLAMIVASFYLLGSLFNDRKERTVLFWKSLPFSETQSVVVKLVFASLVIPGIALALALVVQLVFAVSALALLTSVSGFSAPQLLVELQILPVLFTHAALVLVFALKNLPLYSWLLLASAWSRKSPFLVAILPPLVIITLESLIFGSSHFGNFIGSFSVGRVEVGGLSEHPSLGALLAITPWQAAKITLVSLPLIAASIWLRDHRFEI